MLSGDPLRPLGPHGWIRLAYHFPNFCRLFAKLFKDKRTPLWTKLFLVGSVAYLLMPLDLLFDWSLPGVGYADDLALLGLAVRTFLRNIPPDVLREHVRAVDRQDPRKKA